MSGHPLYAAVYEFASRRVDAAGLGERRRHLIAGAKGRVLEVGAGNGLNLAHYRDVDSVTALEPDGSMRRRLLKRMAEARVPVEIIETDIDGLDAPDGSFDTVVCTLVLCTVPDPASALATIRRVLKPGGRLLFLEHIAAPGLVGRAQHLAAPLWERLVAGCHPDRDTAGALRAAGFTITDCEKFSLPGGLIVAPAMQGVALSPVLAST